MPPVTRVLMLLTACSALAVLILVPSLYRRRSVALRSGIRLAVFALLTIAVTLLLGSPLAPSFERTDPHIQLWEELVEAAWLACVGSFGMAFIRLVIVLEGRPHQTRIVSDLVGGAMFICIALAIANLAFGLPIRGLLATSGVVAIVLGLALQSTLADVFSGIAVGLERPYKPGDRLWVEGAIEGTVLEMNWRSTRIATLDHNIAIIPNSVIAKARLINRSAPTPVRTETLTLQVDATVPPGEATAALEAALQTCRLLAGSPAPAVVCTGLAANAASYEVTFAAASFEGLAMARHELVCEVHRHFRFAGIPVGAAAKGTLLPRANPPGLDETLAMTSPFDALDEAERTALAACFRRVRRNAGETLVRDGQVAEEMLLLTSGTVETVGRGSGGNPARLGPGQTVGAASLVTGNPAMLTATALTPITAFSLGAATLHEALQARPRLAGAIHALLQADPDPSRPDLNASIAESDPGPSALVARLRQYLSQIS